MKSGIMQPTGIFVFTPYGKGEVLGTRNDGIIIVQLRTSQGKPYLGYFHLSQGMSTITSM